MLTPAGMVDGCSELEGIYVSSGRRDNPVSDISADDQAGASTM